MSSFKQKWFEETLLRSWWVLLFFIGSLFFYFHQVKGQNLLFNELTLKYDTLQREKEILSSQHEDYVLQIQSLNDPAWIEMILKSRLGMVGEKERKVYFEE